MRTKSMILLIPPLLFTALAAQAASSGSMRMPSAPSPSSSTSNEDRAASEYNAGLKEMKKGDGFEADAAKVTDAGKQQKLQQKAHDAYTKAVKEYKEAIEYNAKMPEAWNGLGYSQRKLGDYTTSLESYEKALALRPGYPEALEYRGEAYLGAGRIEDAKSTYMDLFASNRALSSQLLTAIKTYVEAKRHDGNSDTAMIDQLDKWVQERSQIASQTAALTREGTAASWK